MEAIYTPRITEFIMRAGKLHDDTLQLYGNYPYSEHIKRVTDEAMRNIDILNLDSDDMRTIEIVAFGAAFHDSIEDARLTYNDVMKIAKEYFDDDEAEAATEIVYALTNEKGRNRAERANEKYYEGIRNTPYASYVKMCDRLANYKFSLENNSRMVKVYEKEMSEFLNHIGISEETFKNCL